MNLKYQKTVKTYFIYSFCDIVLQNLVSQGCLFRDFTDVLRIWTFQLTMAWYEKFFIWFMYLQLVTVLQKSFEKCHEPF